MTELRCPYPGCSYRTKQRYEYERHIKTSQKHCHNGMKFKVLCNGKEGCQESFYTKAFFLEDIQKYLDPNQPKIITCLSCKEKQEKRKNEDAPAKKRRKISKGEALRKAIDFTKETGFDDAYVAGVTHAEIIEYFDGKSMEELEKMDVEGICIAKSFVGLIQIYTRNEDGGGAGVHPSVSLVHSPFTTTRADLACLHRYEDSGTTW